MVAVTTTRRSIRRSVQEKDAKCPPGQTIKVSTPTTPVVALASSRIVVE